MALVFYGILTYRYIQCNILLYLQKKEKIMKAEKKNSEMTFAALLTAICYPYPKYYAN